MSSENPYAPPSFSGPSYTSSAVGGNLEIRNVKADINDILSYSIKVWKENLGTLVCATLIVFGVSFAFAFVSAIVEAMLKGGFEAPATPVSAIFSLVFSLTSNVVQVFIGIGHLQLLLALLRGRQASLGMLFGGGERLLPTIGVSILLGLAVMAGLILLIIPGIIVILFYWPAYSLVVDRKTPVMEAFSLARVITKGNELTTFLMGLLSMGIVLIGFLALCIGIVFAQPLAMLLFACGYLVMSGQLDPKAAPAY